MIKVSDFIVKFLEKKGIKNVFGVTGGGAMHLNDSFGKSKKLKFITTHHEQAAAMAAESYARINKKIGVIQVTTGPGGTNAITGIVGSWIDSIPMLVISGQVAIKDMINKTETRQIGVQEINIIDIVKPITKYAKTITRPGDINYELEKAIHLAENDRPGPVWLDIPLDIQSTEIDGRKIKKFLSIINYSKIKKISDNTFTKITNLIKKSLKPTIVVGNGIHTSCAEKNLNNLLKRVSLPVLSSWNGSDLFNFNNKKYIGRFGLFGDRASNFAIQNSDLIIVFGSRLSQPQIGYNISRFSVDAKIIYIDIDVKEIQKFGKKVVYKFVCDLNFFLFNYCLFLKKRKLKISNKNWLSRCLKWKYKYPVVLKKYKKEKKINSFYFIETLSKCLTKNSIIVTDMGTSFTCTMQTFQNKDKQRLFTSSGLAPMGFGLPGSVGACFANEKKKTICITGDGGMMFNIQELQTIKHHNLPIKIFLLFNNGYLTMKLMQEKNFNKFIGSSPGSGVSCPDFEKVSKSFGIPAETIKNSKNLYHKILKFLKKKGPGLCQIIMPDTQKLIPRVQTKISKKGKFLPTNIDDMYPYLSRKEYQSNVLYGKKNK